MIIPDKKKAIGLIVSKFDGKGNMEDVNSEESGHDDAMKAISEEILEAIKNGSAQDLMMALQAFHQNLGVIED